MTEISKNVMNPARMIQLTTIAERNGEITLNYLSQMTATPVKKLRMSLERFNEYGFITFMSDRCFCITEKGKQYLKEA